EGLRRPRGGLEGGEARGPGLAADQGGARKGEARDGGRQAAGRVAESLRAPVREDPAARGAAEEGGLGGEGRGEAETAPHPSGRRGDRRGRVADDRDPGVADDAGRARQAAVHGEEAPRARDRPGRGG